MNSLTATDILKIAEKNPNMQKQLSRIEIIDGQKITTKEVLEYFEKNFEYDIEELYIKLAWECFLMKYGKALMKPSATEAGVAEFLNDIKEDGQYEIDNLIVDKVKTTTYTACSHCAVNLAKRDHTSNCKFKSRDEGKITKYIHNIEVIDGKANKGVITIFTTDIMELPEEGNCISVTGRYTKAKQNPKYYPDAYILTAYTFINKDLKSEEYEECNDPAVIQAMEEKIEECGFNKASADIKPILEMIQEFDSMPLKTIEMLLKNKGKDITDIEDFVKINGSRVYLR